MGKIDLKY